MNPLEDVEDKLREWLSEARKVVVIGVGNPLRKDDFVGVWIVRELQGKVSENVKLIESETVPESFIEPIARFEPSHILIIDSALLDLKAGSSKLVEAQAIPYFPAISTHTLPLRIFCDMLSAMTRAKIAILAIQPKDVDFGEGLTKEVENAARIIIKILVDVLP